MAAARSLEGRIELRAATELDLAEIHRHRHAVYACELGQHAPNPDGELHDALDEWNSYLVAAAEGEVVGFVSLTPPGSKSYSIDKYLSRDELPFPVDEKLFEARLLTVMPGWRTSEIAGALMYAAFRFVESRGGTRVAAIGRTGVMGLYRRVGFVGHDRLITSGAVTYELMSAGLPEMRGRLKNFDRALRRLEARIEWGLDIPFWQAESCFHGGAFFEAIGEEFDDLERRHRVINADVLDAWFPPAPGVLEALGQALPWLLRTSPPTDACGLRRAIAKARGVPEDSILPGAGSSDLLFLALRHWLGPDSRVLILDPTYGEYAHLLEKVIGCQVDRFSLARADHYDPDIDALGRRLETGGYDLVVLVNPNSPTGRHVPREDLETMLRQLSASTRIWVDETYVEYAGPDQSLEAYAAGTDHVIVCKSMSKIYALSGVRAAYLCAAPATLAELRGISPPWAVSLPAQVAAVRALQDAEYYADRWAETHALREALADDLRTEVQFDVVPGMANFLLCHLPEDGPVAATVIENCRRHGLFLRDVSTMGAGFSGRALRVAVKDAKTNRRMVEILAAHG